MPSSSYLWPWWAKQQGPPYHRHQAASEGRDRSVQWCRGDVFPSTRKPLLPFSAHRDHGHTHLGLEGGEQTGVMGRLGAYDLRVPSNLLRSPHTDVLTCITMSMSAPSNPLSTRHTEWSLKYRSHSRIPLLKTFQALKEIQPPHHGLQHPDGSSLPSLPPRGTFPFLFLMRMTLTYFPFLTMAKLLPSPGLAAPAEPISWKVTPQWLHG